MVDLQTKPKIVAVDGPAGSGKSSLCFEIAREVGWTSINTGIIYRAASLLGLRNGFIQKVGAEIRVDEKYLSEVTGVLSKGLVWDGERRQLFYLDENLTPLLQSEEIGLAASKIAQIPIVRKDLLPIQRQLAYAAPKGVLVDGRDIGTVVFPDADLKVFLTASLIERSRRRVRQLAESIQDQDQLKMIMEDIAHRDRQDSERPIAPLIIAPDAIVIDTSNMTFDASIDFFVRLLKSRGLIGD